MELLPLYLAFLVLAYLRWNIRVDSPVPMRERSPLDLFSAVAIPIFPFIGAKLSGNFLEFLSFSLFMVSSPSLILGFKRISIAFISTGIILGAISQFNPVGFPDECFGLGALLALGISPILLIVPITLENLDVLRNPKKDFERYKRVMVLPLTMTFLFIALSIFLEKT